MQVRVFQSEDMASGLKMIKQELGPDALILSTKTIRNGKFGLLSRPILEITAAIDNDFKEKTAPGKIKLPSPERKSFNRVVNDPVVQFLNQDLKPQTTEEPFQECFREYPSSASATRSAAPEPPSTAPEPATSMSSSGSAPPKQLSGLETEVNDLKKMVKDLAGQISTFSQSNSSGSGSTELSRNAATQSAYISDQETVSQITKDPLISLLIARGIETETAETIAAETRDSFADRDLNDINVATDAILETLQKLIQVINPPRVTRLHGQQRIALIGPTGVGKTTTLAKIAAAHMMQSSNSIALITIDTYRIAAVEQLKVYGEIMHLPVDVVITPEQLEQALNRHKDKELILIDTAGRSPRDSYCIDELASFLSPEYNIEKHLVLSATTRESELSETIRQFQKLDFSNTIFTKIDECLNLGVLLNTQIHNEKPISYITNGQRVPEDLLQITPQMIAKLIMSQDQGSTHE
ncbi:flagellar biosynthesis protein FlhF [Desulforhopalus sp. IMCC35007]|uniref:flagellar biosynthesis protein FlhF n=1 Tax=Desulforhopalus sp. IMCC35007 TaxID=2569543 RepID=UPI0010AEE014|nr:flagellar biosynthesis protein FlhF [Desulforhopalus sp. IMCC35007]TKB10276.1 flagellar biosynthesis protein FlhF [Desulforhopalus sp. IMCC35007]